MNIYDLKYQWRDLVSRNQSVFRFNVGFRYISIDLFDEMIGFYLGMPWMWKWRWETHVVSAVAVYAWATPFFELVLVDRLGLIERKGSG